MPGGGIPDVVLVVVAALAVANGPLAGAIIGFAARQTLANLVAGVMLMIAQPLRIGDRKWRSGTQCRVSNATSPLSSIDMKA